MSHYDKQREQDVLRLHERQFKRTLSVSKGDFNDLAFWAFRYVLGRKSYAVGNVADILIRNVLYLDDRVKQKMISEIEKAIIDSLAGMECDVLDWLEVKKVLESKVNNI